MADESDRKVAVVTGAGRGIGAETARKLVSQGWNVALAARTEADLKQVAESTDDADACLVRPTDVSNLNECERLIEETGEKFGRIDGLVNAAGMASLVSIDKATQSEFEKSFGVNTFGPAALIRHCWPQFRKQKGGRVVNVATIGVKDPFPGFFVYAAAKAALDSFTRSCHVEGGKFNVKAFTVAPGAVETDMLRSMFSEKALPKDKTLGAAAVASVIVDCVVGERDGDSGQTLWIPNN